MSRVTTRNHPDKGAKIDRSVRRRALVGGLTALLVGGVVAGLFAYVADPNHLPIQTIRVSGTLKHLKRTAIETAVASAIDGNFFTVDMARIRDRLRVLSWVDQVSVRRRWPRTLVMQVVEQVPIARWGSDQLVNARSEVFSADGATIDQRLVELDGPQGSAARVVAFHRMAKALLQPLGLTIKQLRMNERREWSLKTDNGMKLLLGRNEATARLRRFVSAYQVLAAEAGRRPARVDLRYAQGFAVTWSEQPTVETDRQVGRSSEHKAGSA